MITTEHISIIKVGFVDVLINYFQQNEDYKYLTSRDEGNNRMKRGFCTITFISFKFDFFFILLDIFKSWKFCYFGKCVLFQL